MEPFDELHWAAAEMYGRLTPAIWFWFVVALMAVVVFRAITASLTWSHDLPQLHSPSSVRQSKPLVVSSKGIWLPPLPFTPRSQLCPHTDGVKALEMTGSCGGRREPLCEWWWGWVRWILLLWPKGNQQLWTTCAKVRRVGVRGGKKWEGAREVVFLCFSCSAVP